MNGVPDERLDDMTAVVESLRARGRKGRRVSFRTDFYALPVSAQDALHGIAVELEDAADDLAALVADLRAARADNQRLRDLLNAPPIQCGCASTCGDDGDTEGPGTCKGLPRAPEPPLVEIMLVHRAEEPRA